MNFKNLGIAVSPNSGRADKDGSVWAASSSDLPGAAKFGSPRLLYSKTAAAEILSLSVRAVEYAIQRGDLKPKKWGRRVLLHIDDLRSFSRRDHVGGRL